MSSEIELSAVGCLPGRSSVFWRFFARQADAGGCFQHSIDFVVSDKATAAASGTLAAGRSSMPLRPGSGGRSHKQD